MASQGMERMLTPDVPFPGHHADLSPTGGNGSGESGNILLRRSSTIGRSARIREAVGRLRVRCVSASQLATNTDVRLLLRPWSSLNPYMLVYLRDRHNQQQSPQRRTRVIPRTLNPQWREEFWFAVSKKVDSLVLHVVVMDQDPAKDDTVLGRASLALDHRFLQDATHKRQVCDLELQTEPGRNQQNTPGVARVEISWEPSLMINSASNARAVIWVLMRSPQTLRVLGVTLLGTGFLFALVAQSSRWLCRGTTFSRCEEAPVPGAETCACLSALGAAMAGSVHFLGAAGLCGAGWDDRPPTLVELAEADIEEEAASSSQAGEDSHSNIQMRVQSSGAFPATLRWDVDVSTNFLPKISMYPIRLAAWLAHLASTMLAELALVLTWANSGKSTFFAEATYIAVCALLCLISAGVIFWYEGRLLRQQADKWQMEEEGGDVRRSIMRFQDGQIFVDGTGGSGENGSPSLNLEQLAQRAQRRIQTQIAQPLLEARQRLQRELDEPNLMRPLLDAGHRLQGHLDDLNLTQPLNEARQRIQEELDRLQPQNPLPRSRSRSSSVPARWPEEQPQQGVANDSPVPWWMQPLFGPGLQQQQQQQQQQALSPTRSMRISLDSHLSVNGPPPRSNSGSPSMQESSLHRHARFSADEELEAVLERPAPVLEGERAEQEHRVLCCGRGRL